MRGDIRVYLYPGRRCFVASSLRGGCSEGGVGIGVGVGVGVDPRNSMCSVLRHRGSTQDTFTVAAVLRPWEQGNSGGKFLTGREERESCFVSK